MSKLSEMLSLRKQRLSLQREADLLEQQEKTLQSELINIMVSRGLDTFTDGEDQASLVITVEPIATSWPTLLDYIRANDALDILQKRLTPSAIKARWAEGHDVPGIDRAEKHTLKFNV